MLLGEGESVSTIAFLDLRSITGARIGADEVRGLLSMGIMLGTDLGGPIGGARVGFTEAAFLACN